jgi:hypothetical protein
MSETSPAPSRSNPGTFVYLEGLYYRISDETRTEIFDAVRLANEIVNEVEAFLSGGRSFEEFEDWSASYAWDIHQQPNVQARELAYRIRGILNANSNNPFEECVREELANAIRPFVELHPDGRLRRSEHGRER